ncbi:hypothetical protein CHCC14820_3822 [Bacillus paralicheniformis]|uniref:Uncharacterized protein n=1 Tax=Bacillus paralicheniformis TaxID=1648923 RepID=A0ABY3FW38_9BACI|nr:hypothetical protein B4123_0354 [Bacillus paralicheniformis]TWJ61681.1 hypothetical protein CHCC5021_4059 [Bacillus paralicheniformis]TWJ70559.1 hypothetical protein CHCC5019_3620 [Bacillus paralicheniformis]TWK42370.1 hypothetical protein CHCC20347_2484 [Bacillus paralicheniformis]TWL04250.1 hypothetical protein CHCC19468_1108 [Bacillus paralicheniformis]
MISANGKQKAADIVCGFQIVDKIPKRLLVLGFCHSFSVSHLGFYF